MRKGTKDIIFANANYQYMFCERNQFTCTKRKVIEMASIDIHMYTFHIPVTTLQN